MPFSDLEFVRVVQPDIIKGIPRYLFEQVEGTDPDIIDRIYKYGSVSIASPTSMIYVLINDQNMIKGILWASVNLIEAVLWINIFSVDKEYQGGSLEEGMEFVLGKIKGTKIKRIECQAIQPKAYEKAGWKRSKQIHLEFEVSNGKDNQDNQKRDDTPDSTKSAE